MGGKYTPLEGYLRNLAETQREVLCPLNKLKSYSLINCRLRHIKIRHGGIRKEGHHVEACAWTNAGWKVDTVNFNERWVRFVRQS